MNEKEEHMLPPWPALKEIDTGRLFYLTKEKISLHNINSNVFSPKEANDFYIDLDNGVRIASVHAAKKDKLYVQSGEDYLDVFEGHMNKVLLKKGIILSFGYKNYEYISNAQLLPLHLSNTYWDENFLQHIMHILGYKTKIGKTKRWIFFWNNDKYKNDIVVPMTLNCFDNFSSLTDGEEMIKWGGEFPKVCKDYYKTFLYCKPEYMPSAVFIALNALRKAGIMTYGKAYLCNKYSKLQTMQDRLVLYHAKGQGIDTFQKTLIILKNLQELVQFVDNSARPRYAMQTAPWLYFRQAGATIRMIAEKYGKLEEYFIGPNRALINPKKIIKKTRKY